MRSYLDFEKPVAELEAKVEELRAMEAEGDAIVAAMPAGAGTVAMVDGAGHYPHAQSPEAVAELVIPFLKEHAGA